MAGTGHSYEIANALAVAAFLQSFAERLPAGPAKDWLLSRKLRRWITAEAFTYRIPGSGSLSSLEGIDPSDVPYLEAAFAAGREVRAFDPGLVSTSGIGLDHLCDWLAELVRTRSPLLEKLPRIQPEDAALRADRWTASLVERDREVEEGLTSILLTTAAGRVWVELLDDRSLQAEGAAMGHCVGSELYVTRIGEGESRIFSLRDGERRLLTAEIACGENGGLEVNQVYGRFNMPVPDHCWDCCAELFNHLDVAGPESVAENAGLARDAEGRWAAITRVWTPGEWFGFGIVSRGDRSLVLSRHVRGAALARVARYGAQNSAIVEAAPRHLGIHELRDLAAVANLIEREEGRSVHLYFGAAQAREVSRLSDRFEVVRDTCERVERGGVEFLVRRQDLYGPTEYLLTREDDVTRDLVVVVEGNSRRGAEAIPCEFERWSVRDVHRAFAGMSAFGVDRISDKVESVSREFRRRFAPYYNHRTRTWHPFRYDATETPSLTGIEGRWLVAPYKAEFRRVERELATVLLEGEGVLSFHVVEDGVAAEAAAFMNGRGLRPRSNTAAFNSFGVVGIKKFVGFLHTQWVACDSEGDFLSLAARRPKGRRKLSFDPASAAAVIKAAPQDVDSLPDAEKEAIALALSSWLHNLHPADFVSYVRGGFLNSTRSWQEEGMARLQKLHSLTGLLSNQQRRRLKTPLGRVFRKIVGRIRRKDAFSDAPSAAWLMVSMFCEILPDAVLRSFVAKVSRTVVASLPPEWDGSPPRGLFQRLVDRLVGSGLSDACEVRWRVGEIASSMLWNLYSERGGFDPDLAGLEGWVECMQHARFSRWHRLSEALPAFRTLLEGQARREGADLAAVERLRSSLEELEASVAREEKERRARYVSMAA